MSEPTKPGYYWAKWKGEMEWMVVYVSGTMVIVGGYDEPSVTWDFTFGPEVTKPDSLK